MKRLNVEKLISFLFIISYGHEWGNFYSNYSSISTLKNLFSRKMVNDRLVKFQTDQRFVDQLIKEQVQASLPIRPAN